MSLFFYIFRLKMYRIQCEIKQLACSDKQITSKGLWKIP